MSPHGDVAIRGHAGAGVTATICKIFDFPAAHANGHHKGHCSRIHGHTWTLEIFAHGPVVPDDDRADCGMVVDFGELKRAYRDAVEPFVEHQNLNESLEEFNLPEITTEWLAWWALAQLRALIPQIFKVRLWEGKSSFAEVEAQ